MVRRSLIGLFNPVFPNQIFVQSRYPDDYFWCPASHTYFEPRIPTRFCFQITNFEFQVREIPDPDNLYCGPLVKHIESTRIHTWGEFWYERSGYARRKSWTKNSLKEAFTAKYRGVLPRTPQVRPKSEIYTPKPDDEHPRPFHMGFPLGNSYTCIT